MLADTDFILALIKDKDWLKDRAIKILKSNKGKISTSVSVMMELALICKRFEIDVLEAYANVLEIIRVNEETYTICMKAALFIKKYGFNVFDSFHAAYCKDQIISSDSVYDKAGIKRIKLEK
jgi:predicted nucleic acid-binding protein